MIVGCDCYIIKPVGLPLSAANHPSAQNYHHHHRTAITAEPAPLTSSKAAQARDRKACILTRHRLLLRCMAHVRVGGCGLDAGAWHLSMMGMRGSAGRPSGRVDGKFVFFTGTKNENLVHVRMAKDDCGNNVHSDDIDHVHYLEIHRLMREKQLNIGYLRSILKSVHDRPLATSQIGA
jgi:hypothetical protein